jgi:hypothetical protein
VEVRGKVVRSEERMSSNSRPKKEAMELIAFRVFKDR